MGVNLLNYQNDPHVYCWTWRGVPQWRVGIAPLVLVALLLGCGSDVELAPIRGKVLYNGQPLKFGGVTFQPIAGEPATGTIQSDGSFTLTTFDEGQGATVGKNQVRVTCYERQDPNAPPAKLGEDVLGKLLIPQRYTSYDTSGLTIVVSPEGKDDVVLELVD